MNNVNDFFIFFPLTRSGEEDSSSCRQNQTIPLSHKSPLNQKKKKKVKRVLVIISMAFGSNDTSTSHLYCIE